jgi:hypothetical protein
VAALSDNFFLVVSTKKKNFFCLPLCRNVSGNLDDQSCKRQKKNTNKQKKKKGKQKSMRGPYRDTANKKKKKKNRSALMDEEEGENRSVEASRCEVIYSYVNCDAKEAFASEIVIEGNVRVVAKKAVTQGALLYRGAPIMHVRGSEMGSITSFLQLLPQPDLSHLAHVTRRTYPVTLKQAAEEIRKTTLCTEENAQAQAKNVYTRLALKFVLNSRDAQVAPATFAAEMEEEEERELKERGPLGLFVSVGDEERNQKEERHAAQKQARNWYVEASKFNHSCYPNCVWTMADNGKPEDGDHMQIIAVRDIAPGEECTIPYWFFRGRAFMGDSRQQRRDYIREAGGFDCECWLCQQGPETKKTPRDYLVDLTNIGVDVRIDVSRFCRNCGAECAEDFEVKKCHACMDVSYCSGECQREHWGLKHKKACTRRYPKHAKFAPAKVTYVHSTQEFKAVECYNFLTELRLAPSFKAELRDAGASGTQTGEADPFCGMESRNDETGEKGDVQELAAVFKNSSLHSDYFSTTPITTSYPAYSFSSTSSSFSSSHTTSSSLSVSASASASASPASTSFAFCPPSSFTLASPASWSSTLASFDGSSFSSSSPVSSLSASSFAPTRFSSTPPASLLVAPGSNTSVSNVTHQTTISSHLVPLPPSVAAFTWSVQQRPIVRSVQQFAQVPVSTSTLLSSACNAPATTSPLTVPKFAPFPLPEGLLCLRTPIMVQREVASTMVQREVAPTMVQREVAPTMVQREVAQNELGTTILPPDETSPRYGVVLQTHASENVASMFAPETSVTMTSLVTLPPPPPPSFLPFDIPDNLLAF